MEGVPMNSATRRSCGFAYMTSGESSWRISPPIITAIRSDIVSASAWS